MITRKMTSIFCILIFSSLHLFARDLTQAELDAASQKAMNQTSTGVQPPAQPNVGSCGQDAGCAQSLQAKYQQDLANYNRIKQAEIAAQQKQAADAAAYQSAQQAAVAAQQQNEKAANKYGIAQTLTQVASMVAFGKFAMTCGVVPPGCQYKWAALGAVMAMFSNQAGQQKTTHQNSQVEACNLGNQISTTQSPCGATAPPFDPGTYPNNNPDNPPNTIVDNTGKCIASAAICDQIKTGLPPGTSLQDYKKGLDAFASGKLPIKVNPDGSVTNTKTGKTITAADLSTPEGLAAAGLSGDQVKGLTAMLSKDGLGLDSLAKKDLLASNSNLPGLDDGTGGNKGPGGPGGAGAANGALTGAGLNDPNADAKRNIAAAEGLAKDFNGEQIGVAGDDIWKMMNRRYRLKETQDSFVSGKPK